MMERSILRFLEVVALYKIVNVVKKGYSGLFARGATQRRRSSSFARRKKGCLVVIE